MNTHIFTRTHTPHPCADCSSGGSEDGGDWINRLEAQLEGSEEDIMEAQEALEEMMEQVQFS